MTPDLEEIFTLAEENGIEKSRVRSVFLFGSRVYGYYRENSDFDIIMVTPSLYRNREFKNEKYNIHTITPDGFKDDLFRDYKITYIECIFAPDWAKLMNKTDYNFTINNNRLKSLFLAQSTSMWKHGKFKMNEGDTVRAIKSAFHSLKTLYFGLQILNSGTIINFSECNDLHAEFEDEGFYEWIQIQEKYLPLKKELEEKLKAFSK